MRLVFHLHFILTWFENVGDEHDDERSVSFSQLLEIYKINIKLTDVDMNVQHKSSIYKFVRSEGEEGIKASLAPPNSVSGQQ